MRFLAEFATVGMAQGIGPGCLPDDTGRVLGNDRGSALDRKKTVLRQDFGLLKFTFFAGDEGWGCDHIVAQVHRLSRGQPDTVPAPITERHGAFPRYVAFEELDSEIKALGGVVVSDPLHSQGSGYRSFRVGSTLINVVDGTEAEGGDFPGDGDVWSIVVSSPS